MVLRGATGLAVLLAAGGCASSAGPMTALDRTGHISPPCRFAVTPARGPVAAALDWTAPERRRDLVALDAWCRGTGPAVVAARPALAGPAAGELVVVSWNLHAGAADLATFIDHLRRGRYTGGQAVTRFVLLLQEAHRGGPDVPPPAAPGAGRVSAAPDIAVLARRLGLALVYVPSMRNGPVRVAAEDRGNAILSTEPLSDLLAIELPFERQRRVAVAATVHLASPGGLPLPVRIASAHLDVAASFRRLWVFGARGRQVRGLLEALPADDPLIVGGDFNTWFGFADRTYRAMAAAVPDLSAADRRPTFGPLRLDHVFSRLPARWVAESRRLDERLGSDHYPLLVRLRSADVPPGVTSQPASRRTAQAFSSAGRSQR